MTAKHTPGPWSVDFVAEQAAGQITTTAIGIRAGYGLFVADIEPHDDAVADAFANARLIAAAPDMYEVLRAVVDINGSTRGAQGVLDELKHRARLALALVDGPRP